MLTKLDYLLQDLVDDLVELFVLEPEQDLQELVFAFVLELVLADLLALAIFTSYCNVIAINLT